MVINKFPDPSLFVVCKEVSVFGPELSVLLESMWETMKANNGMGLAGNQVGLDLRMFVMEGPGGEKYFIVNPKTVGLSKEPAKVKEGCLSSPGEFLHIVDRAAWVSIDYQNELGESKRGIFVSIHSVCVQHEMDHLDGKCFMESKSIPKSKRKELAKKWGLKR